MKGVQLLYPAGKCFLEDLDRISLDIICGNYCLRFFFFSSMRHLPNCATFGQLELSHFFAQLELRHFCAVDSVACATFLRRFWAQLELRHFSAQLELRHCLAQLELRHSCAVASVACATYQTAPLLGSWN